MLFPYVVLPAIDVQAFPRAVLATGNSKCKKPRSEAGFSLTTISQRVRSPPSLSPASNTLPCSFQSVHPPGFRCRDMCAYSCSFPRAWVAQPEQVSQQTIRSFIFGIALDQPTLAIVVKGDLSSAGVPAGDDIQQVSERGRTCIDRG